MDPYSHRSKLISTTIKRHVRATANLLNAIQMKNENKPRLWRR